MPDRHSARAVLAALTDDFQPMPTPAADPHEPDGPIEWWGYAAAVTKAEENTGELESVLCGVGTVGGVRAVLVAFEFGFLGGSIGGRTGALVEAAFAEAVRLRLPVVSLTATGGSRMQEGMRALTQLQRIANAMHGLRAAGLPHIAVLRDPTTGGGWATLGAGADVTLALRGAQVGFAGSRVRPEGPADAYTAESQFDTGQVDQLVTLTELPAALGRWLTLLTSPSDSAPVPAALGGFALPATGWDAVQRARAAARPHAAAYLDSYFDWWQELSGDRHGGRDPGVLCGFGSRAGRTIAFAAQCGTATLPSGFRTAARLVLLADRLGIPVLTLVDTPGAANDSAAERAGLGPAIASLFDAIAAARVEITTLLIGEGGSGGALAFAAPGRTWCTSDSYFSVTAPEAAAAILKHGPGQVPGIANRLRLRPQDLVDLGVAAGIVCPHATAPGSPR
ncbi:carboxyl transferase domain-containing protein [Kibdelosporangium persicum]|uniref:Acetyl-coenzyme A carboxylase carboxyl transferase subunits beta/alpha n=1 Tax=Kibdelosporangium persicum TaxID=2698649 RepID=A0ABX2FCK2_9PSEU|nr:carboxyl transferase domain-containing protein [Kibdelosporangium persicum]NRN68548.1 Acetyl-coenzyme A carboxylase carboxyl transferase subunit beta [Kibdelosporangium persicum]